MRCSNTRPDIIINHLVNTVRFVVHEKQLLSSIYDDRKLL